MSTLDEDERIEAIRRRAYEISQRPDAGTDDENWKRAEEELSRDENDAESAQADDRPYGVL